MKPLSKNEVAAIMKKEVPMLLHKRIEELEGALEKAIYAGELPPRMAKELKAILNKGVEL